MKRISVNLRNNLCKSVSPSVSICGNRTLTLEGNFLNARTTPFCQWRVNALALTSHLSRFTFHVSRILHLSPFPPTPPAPATSTKNNHIPDKNYPLHPVSIRSFLFRGAHPCCVLHWRACPADICTKNPLPLVCKLFLL